MLLLCLEAWQPDLVSQFLSYLSILSLLFVAGCQSTTHSRVADSGYSHQQLSRFRSLVLVNPTSPIEDPYQELLAVKSVGSAEVCALDIDEQSSKYRLVTLASADSAMQAGMPITHYSACGTCSTLQDLSVYLRKRDLTTPVRRCAMLSFNSALSMTCMKKLGLSQACAQTWFFNAKHTARSCKAVCLKSWLKGEAHNLADGSLNACLACDESASGEVFKRVAGRTRRNSGITSAIERGDQELRQLDHNY